MREVTIDLAKDITKYGIYTIPGWKICPTCKIECYHKTEITNEEIDEPDYAFSSDVKNRDVINSTLNELELTTFKVHAVHTLKYESCSWKMKTSSS